MLLAVTFMALATQKRAGHSVSLIRLRPIAMVAKKNPPGRYYHPGGKLARAKCFNLMTVPYCDPRVPKTQAI
jgi:hypothetical protein